MLENGIYKEMRKKRKDYYNEFKNKYENGDIWAYIEQCIYEEYGERKYKAFNQLRNSDKEQVKKLKNHVKYLFYRYDEELYFITFTINDDYMNKVKESTIRRKFITLLSDENISDWIINVDYGEQHDRLHYHAIVSIKKEKSHLMKKIDKKHLKFEPWQKLKIDEKVGHYDVEKVKKNFKKDLIFEEENTIKRLSRYMAKLVMHSIKEKQSYISTKKGTEYQNYKKLVDEYIKISKIKSMKNERRKDEIMQEIKMNLKGADIEKNIQNLKDLFGEKLQISN